MGSPEISAALLKALLEDGEHEIVFVLSNPDTPKGRSGKLTPTPVSQTALDAGIPLYRYPSLKKNYEAVEALRSHDADLFLVFAYGRILPERIFTIPPKGSVNLHASRLPRLRGASPIQSAVLRGFESTAWTLQHLVKEMDAGDIIATGETVPILLSDTAGDLTEKLLPSGINLVRETLRNFDELAGRATPQNHEEADYCTKIEPEMALIDWQSPGMEIHRLIQGMNPSPVARTYFHGKSFKIYRTLPANPETTVELTEQHGDGIEDPAPGTLLSLVAGKKKRLFVKATDLFLEILEVQPENRKVLRSGDFLNGYRLSDDHRDRFENTP